MKSSFHIIPCCIVNAVSRRLFPGGDEELYQESQMRKPVSEPRRDWELLNTKQ
jgi:hypothetical protein